MKERPNGRETYQKDHSQWKPDRNCAQKSSWGKEAWLQTEPRNEGTTGTRFRFLRAVPHSALIGSFVSSGGEPERKAVSERFSEGEGRVICFTGKKNEPQLLTSQHLDSGFPLYREGPLKWFIDDIFVNSDWWMNLKSGNDRSGAFSGLTVS